jgi:DNA primase
MAKTAHEMLTLGGHSVKISNPDKLYFTDAKITKLELVQYYLAVAPGALRRVARRPMVLKRYVERIVNTRPLR